VTTDDSAASQFTDLDAYVGLPRLGGLRLSPDGRRLVVGVALPDQRRNRYTTSVWEVDADGERPARRLTRSADGETPAAFTPDGDLLFVSKRPAGDGADEKKDTTAALWRLPAGGGDAQVIATLPGGVQGVEVARESGTVVLGSPVLPSAATLDDDRELRTKRKDAGVNAILHEEIPVRFWDHDLGPARTRLFAGVVTDDRLDPRDLTGHAGRALHDEASWDVSADGGTIVTAWSVPEPAGSERTTVVAIDVATGERRTLADDPDHTYDSPRLSPDGTQVVLWAADRSSAERCGDSWLAVVPVAGGAPRTLTAAWDLQPDAPRWTPDGTTLVVSVDDHGRHPLYLVDATTGTPTRLTRDDGSYSEFRIAPDGQSVYALRNTVDSPPALVRITMDGTVTALPGPAETLDRTVTLPGSLTEVTTTAEDGTPLRAWLALPHGASAEQPAPMLLWIHGGPRGSWNAWSWRWNPWLAVAQGYAVLLPDPALSTGYGVDFIQRGWGRWGAEPYMDLMTMTDEALRRDDIDANRIAAMGGSFGGYMANWVPPPTTRTSGTAR
jgi:dipeptidyl aminopeptidase/acylaminoacyl peptidase